jgi:uncharacterized protein
VAERRVTLVRAHTFRPEPRSPRARIAAAACLLVLIVGADAVAQGTSRPPTPELSQPVNDFANVIPGDIERQLDQLSRALRAASGDVLVVATVPTIEPYGDIREYAVRMFENNGRGIGEKGKDNGLLIVLAIKERRVQVEVGYDLEQWITDGFAGETSRDDMVPEFRRGRFGEGLLLGTRRIAARIAQGRNVTLDGVTVARERPRGGSQSFPWPLVIFIILALIFFNGRRRGPRRGVRRWGGNGWSGWSSGVGPFGGGGWGRGSGGFGGGFGGFGGGGGFGGFGGGRSGGGGGGAGW